jgi:hypothetical protein
MFAPFIAHNRKKHGQGFPGFFNGIISISWAELPESSCAISTIPSPKAVCHKLIPHLDNDDRANDIASDRRYCDFGP